MIGDRHFPFLPLAFVSQHSTFPTYLLHLHEIYFVWCIQMLYKTIHVSCLFSLIVHKPKRSEMTAEKTSLTFFPSSFPLYILVVFHVFSHPAFTLQATRVMCCSFVTVCMLSCLDRLFLRPQLWEQWKATCFYHFSSVFPDVNSFWGGKLARKNYLCSTQDINIHLYVILNILYYNIFY